MGDNIKPSDFVHLHNHTHHSLLDGLTKIPALVDRIKELGMNAVAITDHGTMAGVVELYKAANEVGIKPILGYEAYVAARTRHDRDPAKDKARYHLTLLAMNNQGYRNLMQLSTLANLEGMYYKPRIDREILEKYNEGIIVLSGCAAGEISECLINDDYDKAKEVASWYKSIFGDRYYLEMQDHDWDVQHKINKYLQKLAKELDISLVVSNDAHYLRVEDKKAHDILLCVGTGSYVSDTNRMRMDDLDLFVTDPNDIIKRWGEVCPEAILNTSKIAERCQVGLELGGILIPTFKTPNGQTEKEYLDLLVYRGLARRYGGVKRELADKMTISEAKKKISKQHIERADYELGVVDNMGFNGYFLIVQDFINWGKDEGIVFGPGRGSAAGSIIAYALNITDLDPLKYGLLFERFLNPDRISMPDIDIDIQDTRRDEVVEYCAKKYGSEHVSNIMTLGKMAARGAVRDVARVLEVPYTDSDKMAKLVPPPSQGRHIPLKVSVKENADLKDLYETNPVAKEVFDYAMQLEGTIRSHGVHACGVVIAPDELIKFLPLEQAQKGVVATQFPMGQIEELGLLKMDFLGLSNLTTIKNTLRIIKKVYGKEIDLSDVPLDDEKAFKLLQKGDTTGVFQLESAGMKRYLKALKPSAFDDIIAMVALYRPGPMQFIDSFIKRKHGEEKITYLHPKFEDALKPTYGILVYQEQFMQISKDFCGFTGGQADTLRKAVGKKKIDLMKKIKVDFVEGAIKHSKADPELVETFWSQLEEFANYCFNKSHAACYGLIAYWTAYLKSHFPQAFMAALMTSDQGDIDRLAIEMNECKHMGIKVLSPDVNQSFLEFAVVPGEKSIRFSMSAVKGVGSSAVEEVLRAREDGKFSNIEDFAKRVSTTKFNRKAWESLIKSGGFDSLGERSDLLFNLDTIQAFASKVQKEALSGQTDLFGSLGEDQSARHTIDIKTAPTKISDREKLTWERELMGLYISAHPLDSYEEYLNEQTVSLASLKSEHDGKAVIVGGLISNIRMIVTRNGAKMAFVAIEDKTGESEIIVFPNLYKEISDKLVQDAVIKVSGKVNAKDRDGNLVDDIKVIADSIQFILDSDIDDYQSTGKTMDAPKPKSKSKSKAPRDSKSVTKTVQATPSLSVPVSLSKLYIHILDPDDKDSLLALKKTCNKHPGLSDVILVLGENKKSALKLNFKVDTNQELVESLSQALGSDRVVVK